MYIKRERYLEKIRPFYEVDLIKVLASFRATLNCSIFITGSNSKLLSGKMATLLVGRCVEFRIMPFSFKEAYDYVGMNGNSISADEFIFNYMNWGGMPLRFSFNRESDIKTYLEQTYNGIVEKDIATERSRINREKFIKVASYVMANAGKEFSSASIETYFENTNHDTLDRKRKPCSVYGNTEYWQCLKCGNLSYQL